ncbi:beta strand repeat-containing protein [Bdellovibrio sp. HCB288]|uniref:beta strand repeat-containing protein n=1 Tax=Bdellovibrio sp. HCB288 TaxID=3394355 RepID=UPI0039B65575
MAQTLILLFILISSVSFAATVTVTSGTKSPTDFLPSDDVVINGSVSFNSGTYNINSLTVSSTRTLTALSDVTAGVGVIINATSSVSIAGTFSADSQGYGSGGSTNAGPGGPMVNGWGATHGGLGGRAALSASFMAVVYGNSLEPMSLGSSGINASGFPGGGAIKIKSPALSLTGTITVKGAEGSGTPGGSSGGSIFLDVDTITGSGILNASGGGATSADGAGGGRIGILSNSLFSGTVLVNGGSGASNHGDPGTYIFRYKSSPNDIHCNKSIGSSDGAGIVLATDLPSSLNNLNLSGNCSLTFFGDVFAGGNISVTGGAALRVIGNRVTGLSSTLAANNISVDSSSQITATGLGYGSDGPGSEITEYPGASHGGAGGTGDNGSSTWASKPVYDNTYQPVQLGSGGYTETTGGGAIRILVVGQLQMNGGLSADGTSSMSDGNGGASGGSLLIYAGSFTGSGLISVNGGNGSGYGNGGGGGGGGGRIAFLIAGANSYTGTMTATGGSSGVGSGGANDATAGGNGTIVNFSPAAATKLAVTTQPSQYARKDVSFASQPVFAAVDANGYMVPTYSTAITIAVYTNATCTTLAGGSLLGTFQNVSGLGMGRGIDLNYNALGTIYIKASSGSLTSACTAKVLVGTVGTKLVLTTQPSATATAGWGFSRVPKVAVQDASGNLDYTYSGGISVSAFSDATCTTAIPFGYPPSAGEIYAGTSAQVEGVTTWEWMTYSLATTVYFKFSGNGLTSVCSAAVVVSSDSMGSLVYTTQPPATATVGQLFSTQPVLAARDWMGNTVSTFSGAVTFATFTGSTCSSGSTTGLSVNATSMSGGTATASGMSFSSTKTIYIKATVGGYSVCSTKVIVSAPTATKLVFVIQPSAQITGGVAFSTQPQIAAQDSSNATATSYVPAIALKAYTDATCTTIASGSLTPTSVTPASGIANVSGLKYSGYGSIYIGASSGSLTAACSTLVQANAPALFRGY